MIATEESTVRETTIAIIRNLDASADEVEPPPSQRALYRKLQEAREKWRGSRGKARDAAMAEMLRLSKAIDQA